MASSFTELFKDDITLFEEGLKGFYEAFPKETIPAIQKLHESIHYSLFSGGKRFRPVLSLVTTRVLGCEPQACVPYAVAVELVHTYSLIHDDLPCMDNDTTRRGQPSNHVAFGEAMALLAGDALLTEAFTHIADSYADRPGVATELIRTLGRAAGVRGMVGGQAMDIFDESKIKEEWQVQYAHHLKTGALIRAAIDGACLVSEAAPEVKTALGQFGKSIGLAFQIADDLEDAQVQELEATSFVTVLGRPETTEMLKRITDQALNALAAAQLDQTPLVDIARYNLTRALA